MSVCVISKDGQPMMPTERYGKVRRLLKQNKAKVVRRNPFTIQLLYLTEGEMTMNNKSTELNNTMLSHKNTLVGSWGTRIVFTDQPAPNGKYVEDVSQAKDNGVVCWRDGDTNYISTQRPGIKVTAPYNSQTLFCNCTGLTSMNVTMLDTSNVTNARGMFFGCTNLETIDGLETWDMRHVTDMYAMFAMCEHLKSIDGLANWGVWFVKNMDYMFAGCKNLTSIDSLHNWNERFVTIPSIENWCYGCKSLPN